MAQVDFSNARIEPCGNVMGAYQSMALYSESILYNSSNARITSGESRNISYESLTKKILMYTGTFISSRTEFYITGTSFWKVSNVSFSNGDTYSFEVVITVNGN
jgi:hypothetical protein